MGKNGGVNYGMGIIAEREIYTWEIFIILDEFLQVNCVCENVMGIQFGIDIYVEQHHSQAVK